MMNPAPQSPAFGAMPAYGTPYIQQAAAPRPSTGLKVLAVIQILFGLFGIIGAPVGALLANLQLSKDPLQQRLHDVMWEGPAAAWSYGSLALGLVLSVLLVSTGIGLWRGKLWSRKTGLVYGAGSLVMLVAGQVVMMLFVYPMLMEQMDASNPIARAGAMGGLIGGLGGALFGAILPAVTLVVLGRSSVKGQLQ